MTGNFTPPDVIVGKINGVGVTNINNDLNNIFQSPVDKRQTPFRTSCYG